jgi:hypothetical protein
MRTARACSCRGLREQDKQKQLAKELQVDDEDMGG